MHDFIPEYYKSFLNSECLSVKKKNTKNKRKRLTDSQENIKAWTTGQGEKRFRQKQGNRKFETDKVRGENRCSSAGGENSLGESQFVQDWPYFFQLTSQKYKI